jgi:hypothetical protein
MMHLYLRVKIDPVYSAGFKLIGKTTFGNDDFLVVKREVKNPEKAQMQVFSFVILSG